MASPSQESQLQQTIEKIPQKHSKQALLHCQNKPKWNLTLHIYTKTHLPVWRKEPKPLSIVTLEVVCETETVHCSINQFIHSAELASLKSDAVYKWWLPLEQESSPDPCNKIRPCVCSSSIILCERELIMTAVARSQHLKCDWSLQIRLPRRLFNFSFLSGHMLRSLWPFSKSNLTKHWALPPARPV